MTNLLGIGGVGAALVLGAGAGLATGAGLGAAEATGTAIVVVTVRVGRQIRKQITVIANAAANQGRTLCHHAPSIGPSSHRLSVPMLTTIRGLFGSTTRNCVGMQRAI